MPPEADGQAELGRGLNPASTQAGLAANSGRTPHDLWIEVSLVYWLAQVTTFMALPRMEGAREEGCGDGGLLHTPVTGH